MFDKIQEKNQNILNFRIIQTKKISLPIELLEYYFEFLKFLILTKSIEQCGLKEHFDLLNYLN